MRDALLPQRCIRAQRHPQLLDRIPDLDGLGAGADDIHFQGNQPDRKRGGARMSSLAVLDTPVTGRAAIPGDSGVWVFIFADMCAFAVFFALFAAGRIAQPEIYEASR